MRPPPARRQAGMTLLELVVVLVLLGVLASFAVAHLPASELSAAELRRAEDALVGDLRTAQARAQGCSRGSGVEGHFNESGRLWSFEAECGAPIRDRLGGGLRGELALSASGPVIFTYPYGALQGGSAQIELGGSQGQGPGPRYICIDGSSGAIRVQGEACTP